MHGRAVVVGCGFIGRHLAAGLHARGLEVTILTRSPPPPAAVPPGARVLVGDAADATLARDALADAGHVFHVAGGLMPAASNLDTAGDVALTLLPLLSVLEALRDRPGVGLTFFSSGGTVYGRPAILPVPEDAPTDPITAYGVLKLAGEKYASLYAGLHELPVRILRCANVYGPGQPARRGQGAIAVALDHALREEPMPVFGDGSMVRDFIHVDDVVASALALLDVPADPRVVNVGSGQGTSLRELIRLIGLTIGRPLVVDHRPARPADVEAIVLDVSRLRGLAPEFAPTPLDEGIARVWEAVSEGPAQTRAAAS